MGLEGSREILWRSLANMTPRSLSLAALLIGLQSSCAGPPRPMADTLPAACVARVRIDFLDVDLALESLPLAGGLAMVLLPDGSRRCFPTITSSPDEPGEGWCRRVSGEDRVLELGGSREAVSRMIELLERLDVRLNGRDSPRPD